jgi:5-amino-6-(5-phosphoribosylamino)uracil reductase
VPRGLITTPAGAQPWQTGDYFDRLWVIPDHPTQPWDWPKLLAQFPSQGMASLALLGGGHLTAELLGHGCIDEVYLTLCPLLLGGATAPTPVDGAGVLAELAPRLTLLNHRAVGDEVFLHYRVHPSET